MGAKKSLRQQWTEIPLERKIAMFVAPVVVFVMTGVLIPRITGGEQPVGPTTFGKDEQVEVVDLVPINSPDEDTRIEISARNIGQTVSVLTRVEFSIEADADTISPCAFGAMLGISQTYDLVLPYFAEAGDVIPVRISQQIGPDGADRFAFDVGVETPSGQEPEPTIYHLGVLLYHDGEEQPIDVGKLVIMEPFPQTSDYFHEDFWIDRGMPREIVQECVNDNVASVKGVLSLPGVRSAALNQLAESL